MGESKQSTRLYITNICSSPVPNLNVTQDIYTSRICIFCLDTSGHTILLTCPFLPFLLLKFKDEPEEMSDIETALEGLDKFLCKGYGNFTIEKVLQTPIFSFTNNRKDILYKLFYSKLRLRQKLVDHLQTEGFGGGDGLHLGDVTIYHQNTKILTDGNQKQRRPGTTDQQLFMQTTGLRAHIWIDVKLPKRHPEPQRISRHILDTFVNVDPTHITMLPELLTDAPISVVYLRLHAKSSTATNTNSFQANAKIPGDSIDVIGLLYQKLGSTSALVVEQSITILKDDDEKVLLEQYKSYIDFKNPQIIIQCSCFQNDLEYLCTRSVAQDVGLSMLKDVPIRIAYNQETGKLMDICHVGRERIDILPVLQKFQVSPPLDGFSLLDAFNHPELINKKKREVELESLPLNPRASLAEIEHRLRQELAVMFYLVSDNSFIHSQCLLARYCDASVTTVSERGVELQTRNCLMRAALKRNLYANHDRLDSSFLVVKRKRCDSSFPHPPELRNVTEKEILGEEVKVKTPKFSMKRFFCADGSEQIQQTTKKSKKGYSGGFVVTPQPGFYVNPRLATAILDFKSLYPSVIVGFGVCYMTVLYESETHFLKDPRAKLRFVPLDDQNCAVFVIAYDGIPVQTLVPEVTQEIMERREKIKAQMKLEKDFFIVATLNARQLTAKVQANGLYGFIGSTSSGMTLMAVAACVCLIAQFMNRTVIYEAHKIGARTIYGDSVVGNTALVVRINGCIQTKRIDELVLDEDAWKPYHGDKEAAVLPGLQVWQDGGFTLVHRIIRHQHKGPILRVLTNTGVVDCTLDHSLLKPDCSKVSPLQLNVGDALLHASDAELISQVDEKQDQSISELEAFAMGLFAADGSCGEYKYDRVCPQGYAMRHTWAINNFDFTLLEYAAKCLPFETKILNTVASSGVFKLVPIGDIKAVTIRYRNLFYNDHGEKRIPDCILTAQIKIVKKFWHGFFTGNGNGAQQLLQKCCRIIDQKGKEMSTGLWILGRRLGLQVSLNDRPNKPNVFRMTYSEDISKSVRKQRLTVIKKMRYLSYEKQFVYDLETESHHFHVAPGDLVVHNTDSTFTQWNICDIIPRGQSASREEIFDAIVKKAQAFSIYCSNLFPKPNNLEFEALKSPILLGDTKKLHCSLAYLPPYKNWREKKPELVAKGPAFKKRDRCGFVQQTGWQLLSMLLHQVPKTELLKTFQNVLSEFGVHEPKTLKDLDPFVITCKLGVSEEYKSSEVLALHMAKNILEETGCIIPAGRRVEYVVAKFNDNRKRYLHAMTRNTFLKNKYSLDTTFYLKTQLLPPIGQLIGLHDPELFIQLTQLVNARAMQLEIIHQKNRKIAF
jgi:DNA polymerase elongation subunit (family B)